MTGAYTMQPLTLHCGNALWSDNIINVNDYVLKHVQAFLRYQNMFFTKIFRIIKRKLTSMYKKLIKYLYSKYLSIVRIRTCVLGKNSVIYPESEIINNLGDATQINIGMSSHIRGQLLTFGHGGKITIGDYCYIGRNT